MDLGDKNKFDLEKRNGDSMNYHSSNMSSEWQYGGANLTNQAINLVPTDNSIPICKDDLMGSSACSSVSMGDSFCPSLWEHPNSQNVGFCDSNVQISMSMGQAVAMGKGVPGPSRTGIDKALDISWNPSISKAGVFSQGGAGIFPQSLSQFPADSAFIERAARFSCFSGGNFGDIVNPFGISESSSSYPKGGRTVQGASEDLSNGLEPVMGAKIQNNELNMTEVSKDVSLSVERQAAEGSPNKNDRKIGSFVRPLDEAKQGNGVSSNESDEIEFSGGGDVPEDTSMMECAGGEPSSSKGISSRKRKKSGQDTELDQVKGPQQSSGEAVKENTDSKQKGDQNPASTTMKPSGKHGKDGSQADDGSKEDYIHVRARRGQATNSHSLAERVRREKISERMKFLQELVPGCSKVTGKAVMLDEIINYVQSLQRQVEFLSMKLAAVNPRLDFNIEGLLAKDILQSRGPTMGFSPDVNMSHPLLHPSQQGLIQAGIPGMRNPSDALRRTINSQLMAMNGVYKEQTQLNNAWDDELHNVVQMNFDTSAPFNSQDLNGSRPPGHMKVEL